MSTVDLNLARDEQDTLCHACAFDVGACRCVVECGALVCTGAATAKRPTMSGGFRVGDHVAFAGYNGETITGRIIRIAGNLARVEADDREPWMVRLDNLTSLQT